MGGLLLWIINLQSIVCNVLFNLPLSIIIIGICFLVSLFVIGKTGTPFYLKFFSPFLLLTLIVELIGFYASASKTTLRLYNFFTLGEFCFYLFIIGAIIRKITIKKIVWVVLMIYLITTLINILFIQRDTFHSVTYSIGCLLIVSFCIYYFFELFSIPNSISLVREPSFWICSGLLFYYCCSFPLLGLINFLNRVPQILIRNMLTIFIAMNFILYTLFIIAFLCRIKIRKSIFS